LIIAVPALGLQLISVPIRNGNDFERAFAAMMRRTPNAAVVTGDPLLIRHISQILDFTEKNRLPTMYQQKRFVVAGGLMSYGVDVPTFLVIQGAGSSLRGSGTRRRGRSWRGRSKLRCRSSDSSTANRRAHGGQWWPRT
jgi:hypothetical protein